MKSTDLGDTRIETGETQIEDMETRHVLEKQSVQRLFGLTTPNVLNKKFLELVNTGAVTITDFLNGAPGQRIYLLGDGFTTIANGTFIKTNTGANKLLSLNIVYKFTFFRLAGSPPSHKWVEDE